ncbi:MAG: hypothetical protein QOC94_2987 [Actinoplanes sp.]|nr:hypothetical protein [Actinoplanes sp.]
MSMVQQAIEVGAPLPGASSKQPAGRSGTGPARHCGPSAAGATAPMGGQAMSARDAWGEGMINEEDRGSADVRLPSSPIRE